MWILLLWIFFLYIVFLSATPLGRQQYVVYLSRRTHAVWCFFFYFLIIRVVRFLFLLRVVQYVYLQMYVSISVFYIQKTPTCNKMNIPLKKLIFFGHTHTSLKSRYSHQIVGRCKLTSVALNWTQTFCFFTLRFCRRTLKFSHLLKLGTQ